MALIPSLKSRNIKSNQVTDYSKVTKLSRRMLLWHEWQQNSYGFKEHLKSNK